MATMVGGIGGHPGFESNLTFARLRDRARLSGNACHYSTLAVHSPKEALANALRQDADCWRVIGVNICSAWRDMSGRAEPEEDDAMREIEIHSYARQLLEAHGVRAIAEAAQNAIELESKGEIELARTWRHIEDAMKLMRGPHQS